MLDEILGSGDEGFRQKCLEKMATLRRRQKTIILVSPGLAAIERWSDEMLWLEDGVICEVGDDGDK